RSKVETLLARGAGVAETPAAAAAEAEATITMVADPEALRDVTEGPHGAAAGLAPEATLIQMSTVSPEAISRLATLVPGALLDGPVLGSISEAEAGTLKIFVGGPPELVKGRRALLEDLGRVIHVGGVGAGTAAKLVANTTLVGVIGVLGEALAAADALGLLPRAPAPLHRDDRVVRAVTDRGRRRRREIELEALDRGDEPAERDQTRGPRPSGAEPLRVRHHGP